MGGISSRGGEHGGVKQKANQQQEEEDQGDILYAVLIALYDTFINPLVTRRHIYWRIYRKFICADITVLFFGNCSYVYWLRFLLVGRLKTQRGDPNKGQNQWKK
jgi:hypothetical protein